MYSVHMEPYASDISLPLHRKLQEINILEKGLGTGTKMYCTKGLTFLVRCTILYHDIISASCSQVRPWICLFKWTHGNVISSHQLPPFFYGYGWSSDHLRRLVCLAGECTSERTVSDCSHWRWVSLALCAVFSWPDNTLFWQSEINSLTTSQHSQSLSCIASWIKTFCSQISPFVVFSYTGAPNNNFLCIWRIESFQKLNTGHEERSSQTQISVQLQ